MYILRFSILVEFFQRECFWIILQRFIFFPFALLTFFQVARRELKAECDYEREARAMNMFRKLLADDPNFFG